MIQFMIIYCPSSRPTCLLHKPESEMGMLRIITPELFKVLTVALVSPQGYVTGSGYYCSREMGLYEPLFRCFLCPSPYTVGQGTNVGVLVVTKHAYSNYTFNYSGGNSHRMN